MKLASGNTDSMDVFVVANRDRLIADALLLHSLSLSGCILYF